MKKNIKRISLVANIFAIIITSLILIGSTFAWFTDSVTSSGNKIQAGTLTIDLELRDADGNWSSIKDSQEAIFNYANWEPGYTDVKILKVENEGSLALKWKAQFVSNQQLSDLADVIDVYVLPSVTEPVFPTRDLDGYSYAGTVADFVNTIEATTNGVLLAGEEAYLSIVLVMRNVGNEYQGKDLAGSFDIRIVATQLNYEDDAIDNSYDKDAAFGN